MAPGRAGTLQARGTSSFYSIGRMNGTCCAGMPIIAAMMATPLEQCSVRLWTRLNESRRTRPDKEGTQRVDAQHAKSTMAEQSSPTSLPNSKYPDPIASRIAAHFCPKPFQMRGTNAHFTFPHLSQNVCWAYGSHPQAQCCSDNYSSAGGKKPSDEDLRIFAKALAFGLPTFDGGLLFGHSFRVLTPNSSLMCPIIIGDKVPTTLCGFLVSSPVGSRTVL